MTAKYAPVALVTGAGKRIGRSIAERLAAEGYAIAVHCNRSHEEARSVVATIEAGGGRAAVAIADLADHRAVETMISAARDALGPVTLLVNNASIFVPDTLETLESAGWEAHLSINLRAPVLLARDFARALPQSLDGCIVNVIDQRVLRPTPQNFSYTLAKSGLWTATRTMAQALAPRIRVNGVGPGPTVENNHDGADGLAIEAANIPLRRRILPEEIADAVVYLAAARNVTGQMIAVDGGQHLNWETPDITAFYPKSGA